MSNNWKPVLSKKQLATLAKNGYASARTIINAPVCADGFECRVSQYNRAMLRAVARAVNADADKLNKNASVRFRADGETEFHETPFRFLKSAAADFHKNNR